MPSDNRLTRRPMILPLSSRSSDSRTNPLAQLPSKLDRTKTLVPGFMVNSTLSCQLPQALGLRGFVAAANSYRFAILRGRGL